MTDDLSVALEHLSDARMIIDRLVAKKTGALAEQLREARERRQLTQQEIADLIRVTRSQIANIERGMGLSVETLISYAAAVDLRLTLQPAGSS